MIKESNKDLPLPSISIIEAKKFLILALNNATKDTIRNCFRKVDTFNGKQFAARNNSDHLFLELTLFLKEFQEHDPTKSFISADFVGEVVAYCLLSNDAIFKQVMQS